MIGRQGIIVDWPWLKSTLAEFGLFPDETTQRELEEACTTRWPKMDLWNEPLFRLLGAEEILSLDASPREGAEIIHDLNNPIPEELKSRFDVVLDGGTLEHIFNVPMSFRNCIEMLDIGGRYIGITPANNWCNHGFYQFSPDLLFRIFSEENGCSIERAILCETDVDAKWYQLSDTLKTGRWLRFTNNKPTYTLVQARRVTQMPIFTQMPQQSYYQLTWRGQYPTQEGLDSLTETSRV